MSDADSSYPRPYNGLSPAPRNFSLTLDAPLVLRLSLSNSKVNQWSDLMTYDFHRVLSHISVDPDVAVVILTGEGEKAFCAGLDVTSGGLVELIEDDPARSAWKLKRHIDEFQASLTMLEGCGKPVIAAVHGVAYGLGVDLMSACDIRYADQGARFSIREVHIGLAADIGSLQRFPRIVGNDSVARELALTAREFGAEEAHRIGFVGKVTKGGRGGVIAEALATAKLIAAKSPVAVRATKASLLYSRDHSVREGLDHIGWVNSSMLQNKEMPEAFAAALSKKEMRWGKL
ncbi:ClpP/crotonase [Jaminaea rosea]|uniref:ClpP/crotonase n=1 Tax=Jaminaea rosea TaxID=1569628 RepID=A0A316UND3_9BASI|nr:ClpP/crotonase [Jaminaea rosea]PWN26454.1 ClpP/crotonase [Jaminaea rosea]